jgi:hypothetical protein
MRTDAAVAVAPEVAGELARIIDGRAVRAVFQPLIDLASGDAVGFEALARGPAGSMLESPGALFEAVAAERTPERAPKDLLLPMSMHIEHKALDAAEPGVLLACFQEAGHFTPSTRARFGRLSARVELTGALGVGMPPKPAPGVRGPRSIPGTRCAASGT